MASLQLLPSDLSLLTLAQVLQVDRLHNRPRYQLWRQFAASYEVHMVKHAYHGTTSAGASLIARSGFRGAASIRAKFGKGIYTSTSVWEALAYSPPEGENCAQTVLVVDMLQGPTAIGSKDQIDFGCDDNGRAVLTLTNSSGTILCASQENQLLPTYKISVRFIAECPFTPSQHNLVRVYHPVIWQMVKAAAAPPQPDLPLFSLFLSQIPIPSISSHSVIAGLGQLPRAAAHENCKQKTDSVRNSRKDASSSSERTNPTTKIRRSAISIRTSPSTINTRSTKRKRT